MITTDSIAIINEFGEAIVPNEGLNLDIELLVCGVDEGHNVNDSRLYFASHAYCGGQVLFRRVSCHHKVLKCGICAMRLHVPMTVLTYRQLKTYLESQSNQNATNPH